jgi:hypothetical protein
VKAYLIITGTIFGLIAILHVHRTVSEWSRRASDPGFYVEGPGLGLVAAGLCVWGFRLLWRSARS